MLIMAASHEELKGIIGLFLMKSLLLLSFALLDNLVLLFLSDNYNSNHDNISNVANYLNYSVHLGARLSLYRPGDLCLSGEEVEQLSLTSLQTRVRNVTIFYRSGPRHKCKIVRVRVHYNTHHAVLSQFHHLFPHISRMIVPYSGSFRAKYRKKNYI